MCACVCECECVYVCLCVGVGHWCLFVVCVYNQILLLHYLHGTTFVVRSLDQKELLTFLLTSLICYLSRETEEKEEKLSVLWGGVFAFAFVGGCF